MTDYTTLIDANTLAQRLTASPGGHRLVLLDARFDLGDPGRGRRLHAEAHLPGAHYADLDADLSGPVTAASGRHPLPDPTELARRFAAWGVDPTAQVVVYDAGNGAFAARLWWLARWLGHRRIAVLDGGFARWQALGLPVTDAPPPAAASGRFDTRRDDTMWLSTRAVMAGLEREAIVLVDARAEARFAGREEPIDPVAGHVPGAVNLPFDTTVAADGTLLPASLLAERFSAVLGDHPSQEMVAMCGSGVTACHLLLGMQHAGLPGGRLYAGSWSEWIRDPDRPVARDGGASRVTESG